MGCFTDLPIFTFLLFDADIIWPVTDLTGSQGGTYEADCVVSRMRYLHFP